MAWTPVDPIRSLSTGKAATPRHGGAQGRAPKGRHQDGLLLEIKRAKLWSGLLRHRLGLVVTSSASHRPAAVLLELGLA